jgi:hypothetical protein
LPVKDLAEKYMVSEKTIYLDLEAIRRDLPKPDFDRAFNMMDLALRNSFREANRILLDNKSSKNEKLKAARTMGDLVSKYVEVMKWAGKGTLDPATQIMLPENSGLPVVINIVERQQNLTVPQEMMVEKNSDGFDGDLYNDKSPDETKE